MKLHLGTLGMPPRSFEAIREKKIFGSRPCQRAAHGAWQHALGAWQHARIDSGMPACPQWHASVHAGVKNEILAKSARAISNFM